MKPQSAIVVLLTSGMLASSCCVNAQLAIDWFTIDGGGGVGSGGGFSITGTIGQPEAGVMRGQPFAVVGGFWSLVAVVPTSSVSLDVRHTHTNSVVISWPISAGNGRLEQTPQLDVGIPWTETSPPYSSNATHYFILVPTPIGTHFYRLRQD